MSNTEAIKSIFLENWASVFNMLLGKEPEITVAAISTVDRNDVPNLIKDASAAVRIAYGEAEKDRMIVATLNKVVSITSNLMMGLNSFKDEISDDDRDAFSEAINQMFSACQVPLNNQLGLEVKFSNIAFIKPSDVSTVLKDDKVNIWKCKFKIAPSINENFYLVTPVNFGEKPATTKTSAAKTAPPVEKSSKSVEMDMKGKNIELLMDVELPITIKIGSTEMKLVDIMKIGIGSIIELEKLVDDPVDVLVNEKLIARGEVVVFDSNFAIRIIEVESKENRIRSLI